MHSWKLRCLKSGPTSNNIAKGKNANSFHKQHHPPSWCLFMMIRVRWMSAHHEMAGRGREKQTSHISSDLTRKGRGGQRWVTKNLLSSHHFGNYLFGLLIEESPPQKWRERIFHFLLFMTVISSHSPRLSSSLETSSFWSDLCLWSSSRSFRRRENHPLPLSLHVMYRMRKRMCCVNNVYNNLRWLLALPLLYRNSF